MQFKRRQSESFDRGNNLYIFIFSKIFSEHTHSPLSLFCNLALPNVSAYEGVQMYICSQREGFFPILKKAPCLEICGKSRSVFWRSDLTNHVKLPSLFASHIVLAFIMPGEKPLNVILSNPMCLHMPIYLNEAFVLLFFFFYRSRVLSFYKYEFYI